MLKNQNDNNEINIKKNEKKSANERQPHVDREQRQFVFYTFIHASPHNIS